MASTDWVLARYHEDVSWTADVFSQIPNLKRVFIYDKGQVPLSEAVISFLRSKTSASIEVRRLPNVGRESHTYLFHMYTHYNDLSDIVFFTQAYFYDKAPAHEWAAFFQNPTVQVLRVQSLDIPWHMTHEEYWTGKPTNPDDIKIGEFARRFMGITHTPVTGMSLYGVFKTTRENIHRYTRREYDSLLTDTKLSTNVHPEEGFYMERLWHAMLCACVGKR